MTTDRDELTALVEAVEKVDRHSPNARYSATVIPAALFRARLHLDRTRLFDGPGPAEPPAEELYP